MTGSNEHSALWLPLAALLGGVAPFLLTNTQLWSWQSGLVFALWIAIAVLCASAAFVFAGRGAQISVLVSKYLVVGSGLLFCLCAAISVMTLALIALALPQWQLISVVLVCALLAQTLFAYTSSNKASL